MKFVAGQSKYFVSLQIAPSTANDPLRKTSLTGASNKKWRKLLGEKDVYAILEETQQRDAMGMIKKACGSVDQIHDITDSILIGLAGENMQSKNGNGHEKIKKTK